MSGLDFTVSRHGDELFVTLGGALNAPSSSDLAIAQEKELADPEVKNVAWDVGGLKLMASAGLRVMMTAIKSCMRQGGEFRLIGASPGILQILRISGLDNYLVICETPD